MAGNASQTLNVRERVANLASVVAQKWANHVNRTRTVTLKWLAKLSLHGHTRLHARDLAFMVTLAQQTTIATPRHIAGTNTPPMLTITSSDASTSTLKKPGPTSGGYLRQVMLWMMLFLMASSARQVGPGTQMERKQLNALRSLVLIQISALK